MLFPPCNHLMLLLKNWARGCCIKLSQQTAGTDPASSPQNATSLLWLNATALRLEPCRGAVQGQAITATRRLISARQLQERCKPCCSMTSSSRSFFHPKYSFPLASAFFSTIVTLLFLFQVLKMYETLVAETEARFSEAEVVNKERQQQLHSFSRCLAHSQAATRYKLRPWQVKSGRQETAGAHGYVLRSTGSSLSMLHAPRS